MDGVDDWDSARIGVVGDLHGNCQATSRALRAARDDGCDTVVSVGDLGIAWPEGGARFVNWLDSELDRFGLRMVFVDGNHEGWHWLEEVRGGTRGRLHRLGDRLVWADRGARWCWQGVRFAALGGSFSVDAAFRTPWVDWWPDLECPSPTEVEVLTVGGPCEVIISHDAPAEVQLPSRFRLSTAAERRAAAVRELVSEAVRSTGAHRVFHGHWHLRYDTPVVIGGREVMVSGLGYDGGPHADLWVPVEVSSLRADTSSERDADLLAEP